MWLYGSIRTDVAAYDCMVKIVLICFITYVCRQLRMGGAPLFRAPVAKGVFLCVGDVTVMEILGTMPRISMDFMLWCPIYSFVFCACTRCACKVALTAVSPCTLSLPYVAPFHAGTDADVDPVGWEWRWHSGSIGGPAFRQTVPHGHSWSAWESQFVAIPTKYSSNGKGYASSFAACQAGEFAGEFLPWFLILHLWLFAGIQCRLLKPLQLGSKLVWKYCCSIGNNFSETGLLQMRGQVGLDSFTVHSLVCTHSSLSRFANVRHSFSCNCASSGSTLHP